VCLRSVYKCVISLYRCCVGSGQHGCRGEGDAGNSGTAAEIFWFDLPGPASSIIELLAIEKFDFCRAYLVLVWILCIATG
jgi:hypothetical protein